MKRTFEEHTTESGDDALVEKKVLESTIEKIKFKNYDAIADRLFGNYNRFTGELLTLEKPPPDRIHELRMNYKLRFSKKYGSAFNPSAVPEGESKLFDIYNNIDLYNKVYYVSQKIEFTCSLSVPEAKEFVSSRVSEWDLVREMFGDNWPRFRSVYPFYQLGMVDGEKTFGPQVLTDVMEYLKSQDRAHIDTSDTAKCITLLRRCVTEGLAQDLGDIHIPIPTANRFYKNASVGFIKNLYQLPTTNFATIKYIYEECADCYDFGETMTQGHEYTKIPVVSDGVTLDEKCITYVTPDVSIVGTQMGKRRTVLHMLDIVGVKKKSAGSRNIHHIVFVFKNVGSMKRFNHLKHCLVPGITRMYSARKFMESIFGTKQVTFYKQVLKHIQ